MSLLPGILLDVVAERAATMEWLARTGPADVDFRKFSAGLVQASARQRKIIQSWPDEAASVDSSREHGQAADGLTAVLIGCQQVSAGQMSAASLELLVLPIVAQILSVRRCLYAQEPAGDNPTSNGWGDQLLRRYRADALSQLLAIRAGKSSDLGFYDRPAGARRQVYLDLASGALRQALTPELAVARPKRDRAEAPPAAARPKQEPSADLALVGPLTRDRIVAVQALRQNGDASPVAQIRAMVAEAGLHFSAASYDRAYHLACEADAAMAEADGQVEADVAGQLAMLHARAAGRRGLLDESMAVLRKAMLKEPGKHLFHLRLAELVWPRDPERALAFLNACRSMRRKPNVGDHLMTTHILTMLGRSAEAEVEAYRTLALFPQAHDTLLLLSNLLLAAGDARASAGMLAEYFRRHNIAPPLAGTEHAPVLVRTAACGDLPAFSDGPLVTVVMTAFDAAETIGYAIGSVLAQTHRNLELIVVDDVSADGTRDAVRPFLADPRVTLLENQHNSGTYVSKNRGIAAARGAYVTLHDSDDWAHPQRLRSCVEVMEKDTSLACMTSQWFRQDVNGMALMSRWRPSITHLNPASTFIRRQVFDEMGYFDSVRVGADAEFLARVRLTYEAAGVHADARPFAIGLHHERSLTQAGANAFDDNRYSPVRAAYVEGWLGWHEKIVQGTTGPFLPSKPGTRQFTIPETIDVPREDLIGGTSG